MAILYNEAAGESIHLRATHVFGRHPLKCDTLLHNRDASQIHAAIRWHGDAWEIRDHSRNGTTIDGKRLAANGSASLRIGQRIQCGPAQGAVFRVASLDAPGTMLAPLDGGPAIVLARAHLLPDDEQPEAVLHRRADGRWVCESADESRILEHGDVVRTGARAWTFLADAELEATLDAGAWGRHAPHTSFHFTVSQNEEHTRLCLSYGQDRIELGERVHHYGLLTLARRRRDDAMRGLDESSQGWVEIEALSRMLGLDAAHLNIQIHRARKQLAQALPEGAALDACIERRRGEVRFGPFECRITRGANAEAAFRPQPLVGAAGGA